MQLDWGSLGNGVSRQHCIFLRGENSFYINEPTDTNQIKTLFNNVTIKTIKGAGHWLQSEQPALFIKETLQFLLNIKNQS